jgi:hypothetical protein
MYQKRLESVGWRRPHRWVKYNLKQFSYYTLPYIFFLTIVYGKNGLTDLHARWLKRRGLL